MATTLLTQTSSDPNIIPTIDPLLLDNNTSPSFFDMSSSSQYSSANKQHNACDECRSRKLKCSGELGGCSRCRTDRVACIYSPRKQMGRPRKKRRDDGDLGAQAYPSWPIDLDGSGQGMGSPGYGTGNDGSMMYAQGASSPPNSYGNALASSNLDYDFGNMGLDYQLSTTSQPPSSYPMSMSSLDSNLPPVDFSNLSFPQQSSPLPQPYSSPSWSSTTSYPSPSYSLSSPQPGPYLASPPPTTAPTPSLGPSCGCLPTLHQTLQTLPSATNPAVFPLALQPLRQATAVAAALLHCQACPEAYAGALQNSMGCTTLLQLIIRGFQGLMGNIDHRARTEEKIQFRFGELATPPRAHHTATTDCPLGVTVDLSGPEWRSLALKSVRRELFGRDARPTSSSSSSGRTIENVSPDSLLGVARGLRDRQRIWHKERRFAGEEHMHHTDGSGHGGDGGSEDGKCICAQGLLLERAVQAIVGLGLKN